MSEQNNVQAAIDAVIQNLPASTRVTSVEGIPLVVLPAGHTAVPVEAALKLADARAAAPRARRGEAVVTELPSFIEHVNRFKDPDSVIFADVEKVKLTAIFDYHRAGPVEAGGQRWGRHRSIYACPLSPQWKLWTSLDGKPMSQDDFATLIDENMADLTGPDLDAEPLDAEMPAPASVLTMVRKLSIQTRGEFTRRIDETTGTHELVSKLEHESTSTKIFRAFLLRIPVFAGADATFYRVEVRIRFRLENNRAVFSYSLYRADIVLQDAFNDVRKLVTSGTGLPLLAASPE